MNFFWKVPALGSDLQQRLHWIHGCILGFQGIQFFLPTSVPLFTSLLLMCFLTIIPSCLILEIQKDQHGCR